MKCFTKLPIDEELLSDVPFVAFWLESGFDAGAAALSTVGVVVSASLSTATLLAAYAGATKRRTANIAASSVCAVRFKVETAP